MKLVEAVRLTGWTAASVQTAQLRENRQQEESAWQSSSDGIGETMTDQWRKWQIYRCCGLLLYLYVATMSTPI